MTRLPYEAETRLLRWAESSTAGRTITIELPPGNGEGHPFSGFPTGHQHGQRFRMRFEAIDDNEEPVLRDPGKSPERGRPEDSAASSRVSPPPAPALHPPAGANGAERSARAKEHYASLDARQKAVADAGRLIDDERFQRFASKRCNLPPSVELADSFIRSWCGVGKKREIAFSETAYEAFKALMTEYKIATGRLAEPR